MKRLRRVLISKTFFLTWGGVFLMLLGLFSSLAGLLTEVKFSLNGAMFLIALSGIGSGIYAYLRETPTHLPPDEIFPEELLTKADLSLVVTSERKHQREANRLAASSYFGVAPLPAERYEQWLMVNPNILSCLFDASGSMVGYFDVFPFDKEFFDLFIEGLCGEAEIRREHILPSETARDTDRIYLGGVAVVNPQTTKGKRYASIIVWGILKYLQHYYCVPCNLELYAEAASPEGEVLLKRFGFREVSPAKQRKSSCALYSVTLSEEFVNVALSALRDWSPKCRLLWT
ncbi:MAG TPA: hypothetical protein VLL54_03110 [Pyrinomonadaceae bacterium]|nr:hypothetical protein [Pyrinomonadaceae bacterium]